MLAPKFVANVLDWVLYDKGQSSEGYGVRMNFDVEEASKGGSGKEKNAWKSAKERSLYESPAQQLSLKTNNRAD